MSIEALHFLALAEGALTGSFVNLVATRLPVLVRKFDGDPAHFSNIIMGIAWPRSHCQTCKATVRLRDLIPVYSYIALRGRCRECRTAFGNQEFLMEISGAIAGLSSLVLFGASYKAVLVFLLLNLMLGFGAFTRKVKGRADQGRIAAFGSKADIRVAGVE